ncbi:unnamed protein product, partial [Didymodactylos carnosus]
IFTEIKVLVPELEIIDVFSDGAASQFKQRFMFRNLVQLARDFSFDLTWNFFATSHGKGVVDGIGRTVKCLVWGAVLAGQTCRSAEDFVRIAKQKTNKITLIELTKNDIDASKNKLQNIFAVVKAVSETLKTHCIKVIDNKAIECFIV